MNKAIKHILMMSGGKRGYGTAGTTTTTSLASQGGLLINIDSATGDIARTTAGFVEDEKYGVYFNPSAATATVKFSSTTVKTGRLTIQLDASVNAASFPQIRNTGTGTVPTTIWIVNDMTKYGIPIKGSTKYRIYLPIETVNTGGLGVYFFYAGFNTAGTRFTNTANYTAGTFNGIKVYEFTSNASDAYFHWVIGYTSGCTGTMNIDWNAFKLEEVVEPVANSLTSSSPSLVSFTAVGSTDNIDQSQLTQNDARGVGGDGSTSTITNKIAQQFLPSKSKLTGIIIRKVADVGVFTGTITAKIMNDNAGAIGVTTLASITLSNASYQAIANDTDYTLNLPCTLVVDGSTKYWLTLEASTSDALNYARIRLNSGNPYTSGICQTYYSGVWNTVAFDLYFKTLYYKPTTNFKASQNNLSVSVSADEDGFLNGSVVNFLTGTATFTETFGTFYLLDYTISGSDLIAEINLPGVGLAGSFTSDRTLEYSSDGVTYDSTFPTGFTKVWVKILAYSGFASFSYSIQFSNSGINVLKNYPTNKDIIKQYSTTLGGATTSATYRATKWGFPAIEYYPQGLVGSWNLDWNTLDSSTNGFNGTASGAITYGIDANGTYADINGDYNYNAVTGTLANIVIGNVLNFTEATDFSWVFKASVITLPPNQSSGLFGSQFDSGMGINSAGNFYVGLRGSTQVIYTIGTNYWASRLGEVHIVGCSYKASEQKFYVYLDGVLQNVGGTAGPTGMLCNAWGIGDSYLNGGNVSSCRKKVYYANVFNRFLSAEEHATLMEVLITPQYLDIDTTASGSTVEFSELGTTYTTVADGASLAISSTSTPNIFVKANITANRLYSSSNDFNASSDKDGSLRQNITYQVVQ